MKIVSLQRAIAGIAFVLLSFVLPAHADTLDDIKKAGKIRIAIDLAIPPFGMTDDKMQPTGSDVDLARLLAKDLGVELEIVTTTGPTRIPMLQTNKADIVVSTLSITPDRAKVIDFTVPYADHPSVVAGLTSLKIKELSDLDGKKVAVVRGTTQDTDLTQKAKGAQLVRYEDDATMALAVASGQVDILATARSLSAGDQQEESGAHRRAQDHHADQLSRHWSAQGRAQGSLPGSTTGSRPTSRTASSPLSTSSITASTFQRRSLLSKAGS